jgi:hypothetical protein
VAQAFGGVEAEPEDGSGEEQRRHWQERGVIAASALHQVAEGDGRDEGPDGACGVHRADDGSGGLFADIEAGGKHGGLLEGDAGNQQGKQGQGERRVRDQNHGHGDGCRKCEAGKADGAPRLAESGFSGE